MARANKVDSLAKECAKLVLKKADELGIDKAEFKEESFLLWHDLGLLFTSFTPQVEERATNFEDVFGKSDSWKVDFADKVENYIEELS